MTDARRAKTLRVTARAGGSDVALPRTPAVPRLSRRTALGLGASLGALLAAASPAEAGPFGSLRQALSLPAPAARALTAATSGGGATAAKQAGLGAQNVAAAAAKFRSLNAVLAGTTYTGPAIPNGILPGGLQQADGVASQTGNSALWSGASPTLGSAVDASGITNVTVTQTQQTAALTWKTFNIGAKTKLVFDQSAASKAGQLPSSWLVINSVQDPSAAPSTILGQISAPGKVYVLNRNGILFGSGSSVNVGALVASSAVIAQSQLTRDANGLISGVNLYGTATGTTSADHFTSTFVNTTDGSLGGTLTYTPGPVTVQAGAQIATTAPGATSTQGGGYVMLLGGSVENDGLISSPKGQVILAAGDRFALQPGYSTNPLATVIGSSIDTTLTGQNAAGTVSNAGVLLADQGDVTLLGHAVSQNGIVLATSTVNTRGTVHIITPTDDSTGTIALGQGSVTEVVPVDDGETALNSQHTANITLATANNASRLTFNGATLNTFNILPDTPGVGRVEISTGGAFTAQGGALVLAQGGQIAVGAPSIALAGGSTLDVSGVNATLSAAANNIFVSSIVPFYLRDSAANRDGGLKFESVYLDQRALVEIASGQYAGNIYTQGGLLEVSGNLSLVPHTISEWAAFGGQVTLQAETRAAGTSVGGTVTVDPGATINLTGGTVSYDAGLVKQSYVETTDGQVFNINQAPSNLVYAGVYKGFAENHPRWQVTENFVNPLLTPSAVEESAYTIGRDAGSLTVVAATASIGGTILAGVTVGQSQGTARPGNVKDPFLLAQTVTPVAGVFTVGDYAGGTLGVPYASSVVLGHGAAGGTPTGTITIAPETTTGTISIDSDAISGAGFANVTVSTAADITLAGSLSLSDGGTATLSGETVTVTGDIVARGGGISLTTLQPGLALPTGDAATARITVANGARLIAAGQWTNLAGGTAPGNAGGFAAGGLVSIISSGDLDLSQGGLIDVSGGGLLVGNKLTGGAGGNVTLSGGILPGSISSLNATATVTLDAQIRGAGVIGSAAGTLSIGAPSLVVGAAADGTPGQASVSSALLSTGFASYQLNGFTSVTVPDSVALTVVRTVEKAPSPLAASGALPSDVFTTFLPGLFPARPGTDRIAQRPGASIALLSTVLPAASNGGGGSITIGQGARIAVDPGQSITLAGYGQVTVLGTLVAHGGTITVANTRFDQASSDDSHGNPSNIAEGLSVWLGEKSLVDASGIALTATDQAGRRFGFAQNGGTINLGGLGGADPSSPQSTYAEVIERPGAVLNASGASTTVDVVPGLTDGAFTIAAAPVTLVGNGGTITARSYTGVALDGTVRAAGGGQGAAGGALNVRLDPLNFNLFLDLPSYYVAPRQILVSQNAVAVQTDPGLVQGTWDTTTVGVGRVSQAALTAGGFDQLSLTASDGILFEGDVNLSLGRALTLRSGLIGDTQAGATVNVSAPYVSLRGYSQAADGGLQVTNGVPVATGGITTGSLTITANLLDAVDRIVVGGTRVVGAPVVDGSVASPVVAAAEGFGQLTLDVSGDIRLGNSTPTGSGAAIPGSLDSGGNITLRAAQVYPVTSGTFTVFAGDNPQATSGNIFAGGRLTVLGQGATPAVPYSVGGTLSLVAETIVQDGVVRAPLGALRIGARSDQDAQVDGRAGNTAVSNSVSFGADSITSVSLGGLTVPYGGTVDGVNYLYAGSTAPIFSPVLEVDGAAITAGKGATLDVSGGGTLAGAGFVFGRGGSVDVNKASLLSLASGTITAGTGTVYAILPGYGSDYAPTAPGDSGYAAPAVGERITIADGQVPGLAGGTYTLLPAYYDLLPGAWRVELTGGSLPQQGVPRGNFTTVAPVSIGTANTSISGTVPVAALFTSGTNVRQLAQYNEEGYSTFQSLSAATFSASRAFLPQDAATLRVVLTAPLGVDALAQPLAIDASALRSAAAAGGRGGALEITTAAIPDSLDVALQVISAGGTVTPSTRANVVTYGLDDAMLSALDVSRLVIGGTLTTGSVGRLAIGPSSVVVTGNTPEVTVAAGANLEAGDVLLTGNTGAAITVSAGATISTIGHAADAVDAAGGFAFYNNAGTAAYPVLGVSNGQIVFTPNAGLANGALITVGDGAVLRGAGSLNFVAPQGTNVGIGDAALGGKYVSLQVANINVGDAATLQGLSFLPSGLLLDARALQALVGGTTVVSNGETLIVPAATELTLTANQAVNIVGSVTLDSQTTNLTLYTPAIYGYSNGDSAAAVSITAPIFTWGGISRTVAQPSNNVTTTVSGTPGGQVLGSGQNVSASLTVNAKQVVFGYGANAQPNTQVVLNRALVGFGQVTFAASDRITANAKSALAVYATQPGVGQTGTGGDLTLSTPLLTTDAGAVLDITAGGTLSVAAPASGATATAETGALGGRIDLAAASVALDTGIALHSGRLDVRSGGDIALGARSTLDLSGRDTALFDQTASSTGGTLALEAADGATPGNITQAAGGVIDVSAPTAEAGAATLTAHGGTVALGGTLRGSAGAGLGGTLAVTAASLGAGGFDGLTTALDAGGFTGARALELTSGNLTIDQTLRAHAISVAVDAGSLTVAATLDASGARPGAISLAAGGDLAIASGARLDAHATTTAVDSYGQPIDASNRARVALTSAGGTVTLGDGAAIDVSYPGAGTAPQGTVAINAPRLAGGGIAIAAPGSLTIAGAREVDLAGFRAYAPTDANGTVVQDNGAGTGVGHGVSASGTLGLAQIDADSQAWIKAAAANGTLASQLAGLTQAAPGAVHLMPGVEIDGGTASNGKLTLSGDLDFSGFRYSAPTGLGLAVTKNVAGSGEAGSIVFRAPGNLTVNGSVSDGFAAPPDSKLSTPLTADTGGWVFAFTVRGTTPVAAADPTNADIYLPSSSIGTVGGGGTTRQIVLNTGSTIPTARPISLNYDITVGAVNLRANTLIPFAFSLSRGITAPAGGFIATAPISRGGTVLFAQGALVPGGTAFLAGDRFGAGSIVPVQTIIGVASIPVAAGTVVPAGTSLQVVADDHVTLSAATAVLPADAFIPAGLRALWGGVSGGSVQPLTALAYRAVGPTTKVQGYLYPLAQMLPAGSRSWDMAFTAGADAAAANPETVLPASSLATGQGNLLIDDQHYVTPGTNPASVVAAYSVLRTGTGDLTLSAGGDITQASLYGIYTAGTQAPLGKDAQGNDQDAQFNPSRYPQGSKGALLPGDSTVSTLVSSTYQAYYPTDGGDLTVSAQGDVAGDVLAPPVSGLNTSGRQSSDLISNWLWRQGSPAISTTSNGTQTTYQQSTSWWINFGTFLVPQLDSGPVTSTPQLVGFEGWGALGGGNVRFTVGGNAGQSSARGLGFGASTFVRGEGLVIAVGGTGRLLPGSTTPVLTGGGSLTLDVAGSINALDAGGYGLGARNGGSFAQANGTVPAVNGDIVNLRGDASVTAGSVGRVDPFYAFSAPLNDPRTVDAFTAINGIPNGGLTLAPGDGTISLTTDGDAVVAAAADPTRVVSQIFTVVPASLTAAKAGNSGFTLWRPDTGISIFSAGGEATPTTLPERTPSPNTILSNGDPTDFRSIYPANLYVTAVEGDIVYGLAGRQATDSAYPFANYSLETMPSATGQVQFLAGGSIWANNYSIDMSGADPALLSTPQNPAFTVSPGSPGNGGSFTNIRPNAGTPQTVNALFALAPDTPTTNLHADDPQPARFYAATGDIVNFQTGETLTWVAKANETLPAWYIAAKPVQVVAGRDIVSSGTRPADYPGDSAFAAQPNQRQNTAIAVGGTPLAYSSGNLALNTGADSVSLFAAGRDILSTYAYVGGPGQLVVEAGRNIYQAGYALGSRQVLYYGNFKTLGGGLIAGAPLSLSAGADLTVLDGFGGGSPDYQGFARVYFDPAYQANLADPIAGASNTYRVQLSYATPVATLLAQSKTGLEIGANGLQQKSSGLALIPGLAVSNGTFTLNGVAVDPAKISPLSAWLATKYGYTGDATGAAAYFAALPASKQQAIVWHFYFLELNLAAFQYNDPTSAYYRSYARGSQVIDTLLPPRTELVDWLRAYHGYTGDASGALAAFNALPSGVDPTDGAPITPPADKADPAYFRYLVWQNDLQVTTLGSAHVSVFAADPTTYPEAAASEAAIRAADRTYGTTADSPLALPASVSGIPLSGIQGVPDGYLGTIQNSSGLLTINTSTGSAPVTFDAGFSTRGGGTINVLASGTPTATPTLRANSLILGATGGVAPGSNTGVVAYGVGDVNLWSTGNQLLGQSRVFTLDGGSIIMWASAGDVNAGIGAQTSVTYNPPAYVYDTTGGIFVTPPSAASGAGIGALQVIPGAAAGSVNLVAPIGTVDLGEAGARAAGNLNLLGRVLANTANASAGRVATSNVSVTTSGVQALAASSASAAATAASNADDKRKSDRQDPSVIEVEVVAIGGTFEEEERRRRRR